MADKDYVKGRGYSKADWDAVSDTPEWTAEDFQNARPFAEVFPELSQKLGEQTGRQKSNRPASKPLTD